MQIMAGRPTCRKLSLHLAGIAYMIISPVITGFAVAAFALSYIIYKYLYTWVVGIWYLMLDAVSEMILTRLRFHRSINLLIPIRADYSSPRQSHISSSGCTFSRSLCAPCSSWPGTVAVLSRLSLKVHSWWCCVF
jgi:hypothetical protein